MRGEKRVIEGLWEYEEVMEEDRVRMYRIQGLTMRGECGWGKTRRGFQPPPRSPITLSIF